MDDASATFESEVSQIWKCLLQNFNTPECDDEHHEMRLYALFDVNAPSNNAVFRSANVAMEVVALLHERK